MPKNWCRFFRRTSQARCIKRYVFWRTCSERNLRRYTMNKCLDLLRSTRRNWGSQIVACTGCRYEIGCRFESQTKTQWANFSSGDYWTTLQTSILQRLAICVLGTCKNSNLSQSTNPFPNVLRCLTQLEILHVNNWTCYVPECAFEWGYLHHHRRLIFRISVFGHAQTFSRSLKRWSVIAIALSVWSSLEIK